jgi:hypothetical protein
LSRHSSIRQINKDGNNDKILTSNIQARIPKGSLAIIIGIGETQIENRSVPLSKWFERLSVLINKRIASKLLAFELTSHDAFP